MVSYPQPGEAVKIRYSQKTERLFGPMPLQDYKGVVEIVGHGKPRNHGVRIGEVLHSIPCGNLMKVET